VWRSLLIKFREVTSGKVTFKSRLKAKGSQALREAFQLAE
jgi:hypothetical protein